MPCQPARSGLVLAMALLAGMAGRAGTLSVHLAPKALTEYATYDWMAFQDGERPWQVIDPAREAWRLPVRDAQGRYGLAWVQGAPNAPGLGPMVSVLRSDLRSDPRIVLDRPESEPLPADRVATDLRFLNLPGNRIALVDSTMPREAEQFWGIFGGGAGSLDSPGFPVLRSPQDVTVVQCRMDPKAGYGAEKALRLPGFDPAADPGRVTFDLALAQAVETYSVPLEGPPGDQLVKGSGVPSVGGAFFGDPAPDRTRIQGVHLPWALPGNLTYTTEAIANYNGESPQLSAWTEVRHHQTPPARLVLPEPLEGMAFQVGYGAQGRLEIVATAPATAAWDGYRIQAARQMGLTPAANWTVSVRNAGPGPVRVELPDFQGLPGWKAGWELETDPCLLVEMTALRCNLPWSRGFGIEEARDGQVLDGTDATYLWPVPE